MASLGFQVKIQIFRDGLMTPWGFRLAGGKDFNAPLIIQRVQPQTPSETFLERGDVLLSIDAVDVTNFTHSEALAFIRRCGGNMTFNLIRGCSNPMSLMIRSETLTPGGMITSYTFDIPEVEKLPTMHWDPSLFVRNNPIVHARKGAEAQPRPIVPDDPDAPVEPLAPPPVPIAPPKPINHREMAHKISQTVIQQAELKLSR